MARNLRISSAMAARSRSERSAPRIDGRPTNYGTNYGCVNLSILASKKINDLLDPPFNPL
jgi:hypothetical protein